MDYVKLGRSGLEVSRICLGCMSYGVPERGTHAWTLNEERTEPFIRQALDLGINFFDTANVYSDGTSEEIVGQLLRKLAKREDVVIATKVHGRMRPGAERRRSLAQGHHAGDGREPHAVSASTTSTSTRSIAGTTARRSRKPWRLSMTW